MQTADALTSTMRWLFILLLFGYTGAKAQILSGRILADSTNRPLTATVSTHSGHQTSTNANGDFTIVVSGPGDTVKILAIGYKPYAFPVLGLAERNVIIRLKQVSILLKEVAVKAARNRKKDSIALRKDYSQVFNYEPPKVKDAFVSPPSNVPFAFVSIDLLTLFQAATRKSDPKYKLKKELLRDEEADYLRTRFNRGLVTQVTHLEGDSLNLFIDKYYPRADWVCKASDYDMIQYIKAKALEFRKKD